MRKFGEKDFVDFILCNSILGLFKSWGDEVLAEWQHVFCYCIGKFSISICVLEVIEVVYEKKMLPRFPKVPVSLTFPKVSVSLTFSPGDSEDGSLEIKEALGSGRWR